MHTVRRIASAILVVAAAGSATACGGSITDVSTRPSSTTAAPAVTPFCEALDRSQTAGEPLSRSQAGRRIENVGQVADQLRTANAQVAALSPPELRGDVDLVTGVVNRQLRVLEDNDGDTLALARDAEVTRATSDPAYDAAARRVGEYVRRTC